MVSSIEIRMVCVMKRKNTDQLLKELMDSNDLSRVLSDNSACFREGDLPHGLQMLFDQQDMSKSALAKASGISEVYLHQVFSGRRTPSRDRLLCLCIGLGASAFSIAWHRPRDLRRWSSSRSGQRTQWTPCSAA